MSDYANPAACYGISILFSLLGILAVVWRFNLRRNKYPALSVDDWLCIPALTFTISCAIVIIAGTAKGAIGRHSNPQSTHDVMMSSVAQQTIMHQCSWAFNILAYFALGSIKLSFLFFYRRIFRGKIFNIISWCLIALVSLWTILFALVLLFMCGSHFSYIWGPLQQFEMTCLNVFKQNLAGSVLDVVIDIFILAVPIVMVWRLKLPVRNKFAVSAIFLTAGLSIAASICRLVINVGLTSQIHVKMATVLGVSSTDEIGMSTIQLFWSMIEIGVALIAVCMPSLRLGTALPTAYAAVVKVFNEHFLATIPDDAASKDHSLRSEGRTYRSLKESKGRGRHAEKFRKWPTTPPRIQEPYEVDGKSKSFTELDGKPRSIKELEGDQPYASRALSADNAAAWMPCSSNWPLPARNSIFIKPPPRGTSGRIIIAPPPNTPPICTLPQQQKPCFMRRIIAPPRISSAPGPSRFGKPKSVHSGKSQKSIKELEGDFPPLPMPTSSIEAIAAGTRSTANEQPLKSGKSLKELEGDAPAMDPNEDTTAAKSYAEMLEQLGLVDTDEESQTKDPEGGDLV